MLFYFSRFMFRCSLISFQNSRFLLPKGVIPITEFDRIAVWTSTPFSRFSILLQNTKRKDRNYILKKIILLDCGNSIKIILLIEISRNNIHAKFIICIYISYLQF